MKKLLVFLMIFGVLCVFSFSGFVAADTTQNATTTILLDLSLTATPNPVDFGSILPGATSDSKNITLTPGVSDLNVIMSSTPGLFESLKCDVGLGLQQINSVVMSIIAGTPDIISCELPVPLGYHSGSISGVITYLVTEAL